MSHYFKGNYWFVAILFAIAILYSIFLAYVPFQLDDWIFMSVFVEHNHGQHDFDWNAYLQYVNELRNEDNSRLCNLLAIFTTMFRPWRTIFPLVTGICYALGFYLMIKISSVRQNKAQILCYLWIVLTIFLPWRDNIAVRDYSLNYVYSSFLALSFIYLLIRFENQGWNWRSFSLMLLLGIVSAAWHEGFAIPTIAGCGVLTLLRRFRCSPYWYIIGSVYIIVTFVAFLSPGMINRMHNQVEPQHAHISYKYFVDNFLPFTLFCLFVISLCFKKLRWRLIDALRNPYFVVFITSLCVGIGINLFVTHYPRMSYWPNMCAVILLLIFFKSWLEKFAELKIGRFFAIISAILCLSHLFVVIYWQRVFFNDKRDIEASLDNGCSTVFYDVIDPDKVPLYTLYYPTKNTWFSPFNYVCLAKYHNQELAAVVPTALNDASPSNSTLLPGSASIYRKDDALWFKRSDIKDNYPLSRYSVLYLDILGNDGLIEPNRRCFILKFVTLSNDTLYYVKAHRLRPETFTNVDFNHFDEW